MVRQTRNFDLIWFHVVDPACLDADPSGSYDVMQDVTCQDDAHANATLTRTCSVDVKVNRDTAGVVFMCSVTQRETSFHELLYLKLDINSEENSSYVMSIAVSICLFR